MDRDLPTACLSLQLSPTYIIQAGLAFSTLRLNLVVPRSPLVVSPHAIKIKLRALLPLSLSLACNDDAWFADMLISDHGKRLGR